MNMNRLFLLRPIGYLDPGSGSFILQILLATLLGGAVAIRIYWKKIVNFFKRNNNADLQDELDRMDEYGGNPETQSKNDDHAD